MEAASHYKSSSKRKQGYCCANDVITIFNSLFLPSHNTELRGGANEPIYLPASKKQHHHLIEFRSDYVASALHEIAHWCIAGAQRRTLIDYGYWYAPDGRNQTEQNAFLQVEVKPQALEYLFSKAAGINFSISIDNLSGGPVNTEQFEKHVADQAVNFLCLMNSGSVNDSRASRFIQALQSEFNTGTLTETQFIYAKGKVC